ncbi:MerR family transcriptional regulator [Methylobacterium sp. WL6]|uniref:MerR family transcriptional regulator n=1 Tax=Methylobacterium sp. WL6 TaxID=2603901 RepID=UPI0011CC2891|nr:MerR family transcriptional regulator [Methylobacterium sp. WL6]TXN71724.1 MerR family transcriptional regulator [Methylobacterium sp. WL6]
MNAHMMHTAQGAASVIPQKFRRPDPAPPGPMQPGKFRLARLSEISGVELGTISNWTSRRIWNRQTSGEGKHRRFGFWDCLHLAIIREMASLGMQLSGRGAILSESLLACAKAHVGWDGDLNSLPDRIALYALDDEREWMMDWQTPRPQLPRSYVVLNLRAVVEDVNQRYHVVAQNNI